MQTETPSKTGTRHLFTLIALCIEEAEDNDLRNTAKKLLEAVTVFQAETKENAAQHDESCAKSVYNQAI